MKEEKRVKEIIKILKKEYPHSKTALNYRTPHQMLVSTILSAQCTDKRVNEVTRDLFRKYKNVKDFAKADMRELEQDIRSTGFYKNKAKNIINSSRKIVDEFNSEVPDAMNDLLKLPGVARKTANVVLSSAFGKSEGIVVDTHVRRLSQRLELSSEKSADKIEKDLMDLIPLKYWNAISYMLINHGRKVCKAKKPNCSGCVLNELCSSAFKI